MITYKYFRNKYFVLSDKPVLDQFGKIPIEKQDSSKPVGFWFSKGLQWFNLVLNSFHGLYDIHNDYETSYTNKTLYLHEVELDWKRIRYINDEHDALQLIFELYKSKKPVKTEQNHNKFVNIWKRFITANPDVYGIYINLNNRFNIEAKSRRGQFYASNTEQRERTNLDYMNQLVKRYFKKIMTPQEYAQSESIYFEAYTWWYTILSVSSGCIWDDRAINFTKSKLILELPVNILEQCKASDNSILTLLQYINDNTLIKEDIDNNIQPLNRLFKSSTKTARSSTIQNINTNLIHFITPF